MSRRIVACWSFACAVAVLISPPLWASTSRLRTLGGETRLLIDDTNLFVYPASVMDFREVLAEPFDDWAAIVYGGRRHAFGATFERPIPSAVALNAFLDADVGGPLGRLNARPWFDLLYGVKLSQRAALGVQANFSYDTESDGFTRAASAGEVNVGLSVDLSERTSLDLAVRLSAQRFEDDSTGAVKSKGGTGVEIEGRLLLPFRRSGRLIPIGRVAFGGLDVRPDKTRTAEFTGGLGANVEVGLGALAILGAFLDVRSERRTPVGAPQTTDTRITLPRFIVAAEAKIGPVTPRLGLNRSTTLFKNERLNAQGKVERSTAFDADFHLEFGLGLKFGGLELDGVLEKDLLRDGLYLISGGRHGGGLFSNATLTYRF